MTAAMVLLVSVGLTYLMGRVALDSNRDRTQQREIIGQLERVASDIKDAETGQRGYLLTGKDRYLRPYNDSLSRLQAGLEDLDRLGAAGLLPKPAVAGLRQLITQKLAELQQTIQLKRANRSQEALAIVESDTGRELMDSIRSSLADLEQLEVKQFEAASARSVKATRERNWTFIGTAVLNLGLFAWAYRRISGEIHERELAREELKRSHAELEVRVQERTTELAAANRELEAFGYSVSHDLRAPLRHVSSFIRLLEKSAGPALNETSQRQVRTIAEAAARMGHLIDDLLVLSRIGRTALAETTVSLRQLVEEAQKELAPETANRPIEWRIGELPLVRGDPTLLRSAMVNLISNAVKYTRHKVPAHIEVGSTRHDGEAVIFIRDDGAGFDMQFVDKLFGVFQRLHNQDEFEGTGIGLASVRRIIQRHGGKTWAEGQVDCGATFYFTVPRERLI
jgi:signal transduction histidine kinase